MEVKSVPWWRKALNFALSGIRSGFGLFPRVQKPKDNSDPETAAEHEEIREEETPLTEYSPKQDSIVEAESRIEAFVDAAASDAEVFAKPEVTEQDSAEAESKPDTELLREEERVLEPEFGLQTEEVQLPEPDVEAQPEELVPVREIELQAEEEPAPVPEAELQPEEEHVQGPAVESRREEERVQEPEFGSQTEEVQVPEADAIGVPDSQRDARVETGASAELAETAGGEIPQTANDVAENATDQVIEPQVTFEKVAVDEVTPQAEAAICEEVAPGSSPAIPNETGDPASQGTEAVPESVADVAELVVDHFSGQVDEETTDPAIEAAHAVTQPMELNHPNSEPAAEKGPAADNAAPIPAEESALAATDANSEASSAANEAETPATVTIAAQQHSKPFIKLEPREGEANASPFSVIVSQVYDGPLDLLLDLIRKQDIDIYDIPIARITAQFLAYVDQLKATDVDVAGEFIYTASLLIHIKSKMLLPRAPSGPEDAAEDPRRELVQRLLEHERFKNAAQMLQQKQMLEAATWSNPGMREFKEDAGAEPEIAADTVDLVRVFQDILERARNRPVLNVQEDSVTVGQMIQFLSRRLTMEDKPIALRRLLSHTRSERALIAMFLALLELVRLQAILLRQDSAFCEIFIKKQSNFESVMNESVSHDDWK